MWQRIAALRHSDIPSEQLDAIAPILEALFQQVSPALDHDLSTTDPALIFHCDARLTSDGFDER